jgi:hypothetical protein
MSASSTNPLAAVGRQVYDTPESAAARLGLTVEALRARCRRSAALVGDRVEAHLGAGIVAFKFGRSWRFRFPA